MRALRWTVALVAAAAASTAAAATNSTDRPLLTYTVASTYVKGAGIPLGLCATDLHGTTFRVTDPRADAGPMWSPDARSLAFSGPADPEGQDHFRDLFVTDAQGRYPRDLTRNGGRGTPSLFAWSPDRTEVAGNWAGLGTAVFIAKADGTGTRGLAYTDYGSYVFGYSWSPDGRRILLGRSSFSNPAPAISVIDVDGTNERKLLDSAFGAAWSPDGQRFAYLAYANGKATGLGIADADGSNARVVLRGVNLGTPTWSPDGSRLASVEADGSLGVVGADGSDAHVLINGGVIGTPQWSPDGSLIAFTRGPARAPRVAVVKPGGGREQDVAAGSDPAWRVAAPLPSDRRSCIVRGTSGADVIHGTDRGDAIFAGRGKDRVYGGGGDDVIVGGLGQDRLLGGAGNDVFNARDRLRDFVFGGPGSDTAYDDSVDVLKSIEH